MPAIVQAEKWNSMKFFVYDNVNGTISINDESILLTKEFSRLIEHSRNKTNEDKIGSKLTLAFKEFKFIYLFIDWESPYFNYSEKDRHLESLKDSELTEQELEDIDFINACRKYDEIQNSSLEIRLLKGAMASVENLIYYLEHVDLNERDPQTGKPIFKSKDLIIEIKGCKDVISGLRDLTQQVKKGQESRENLRGDVTPGLFD